MDEHKKYKEWRRSVSDFLGKDFLNDFQDMFTKDWPPVNLYESDTQVICLLQVPGVRSTEDLHMYVYHQSLVIKGERHMDFPDRQMVKEELKKGPFKRTIQLPSPVKTKPLSAHYRTGMLTVTLEKIQEEEVNEISVEPKD